MLARSLHVVSFLLLVAAGLHSPHLGWIYGTGLALAAALLLYEHGIVRAGDLSRVDVAFFTLNGAVSLVVGLLALVDAFV